jgi:hypothetical protein
MQTTERKAVLDQFVASEAQLLRLVDGLTPGQVKFQTSPDRWSIADVIEHVMAVETRLVRAIGKTIKQPSARSERPDPSPKDAELWKNTLNRKVQLQAPEPVRPTGKFADTTELLIEFRGTRSRTVQFVESLDADLRGYTIPHMAFGELDLYQWLIVLSMHGSRHALQIEEIKAHNGYPA